MQRGVVVMHAVDTAPFFLLPSFRSLECVFTFRMHMEGLEISVEHLREVKATLASGNRFQTPLARSVFSGLLYLCDVIEFAHLRRSNRVINGQPDLKKHLITHGTRP